MTKFGPKWFLIVATLLISTASFGQKVKYKDIFGLLSTKQYESAEPFLKKYLRENDDNPNAFLYMGIIFQEKSAKMDVLKQTTAVLANIDSSIMFFDKAYKTVDEREVKKNKDYYQIYNRRDVRTGEFGVKLPDIQFDLEKRIQAQKERTAGIKLVKHYFALADTTYKKANGIFVNLQNNYPSERQLYLRADETTVKDLKALGATFDSCTNAFDHYKTSVTSLGRTGYNQTLVAVDINDFKTDGKVLESFYNDRVNVWDYKKFADRCLQIIEHDVMPLRNHLVKYDIEINKLRERLNNDSISVKNDLTKLIDVLLYEQLKKYDDEPLPMQVFYMKTADLEYRSSMIDHKKFRDSSDVHLKLKLLAEEMAYLNRLDSATSALANADIDQKAIDYAYFITNTYNNTIVLHSYIKALNEYAQREKRTKVAEFESAKEAVNWIVDGTDSVSLMVGSTSGRFKPLLVENEKFTVGLSFKDSINADGYFYKITPSRKSSMKFTFPVDKASFKEKHFDHLKALTFADPQGHVYYILVYSDLPAKDKIAATLAKIYSSDGLAWSNNIQLGFIPKEINFKAETSELTIKDDVTQTVIDKNGKVVR